LRPAVFKTFFQNDRVSADQHLGVIGCPRDGSVDQIS
jgi:hypothetical protein